LLRVDDQAEGTAEGLDPVAVADRCPTAVRRRRERFEANRYSGWPFQVIWLRPLGRPATPTPAAGRPL
jgi:hypothetical protein